MIFSKSHHTTRWIPVKDLDVVWVESQRPFHKKWGNAIAKDFDPDKFGVLTVSAESGNGHYHLIDGQHRKYAVETLFGDEEKVPCNIMDANSPAEAAAIFDTLNTARKGLQAIEVFNVRVTAGEEAETAVMKIFKKFGYRVSGNIEDGTIRAVNACLYVFKKYGPEALEDVLSVLQATWGMNGKAVDGVLIRGYADFIDQYPTANFQRIVEKISSKFTPERFIGEARTHKDMFRSSIQHSIVELLKHSYNHGRRRGRLE